MMLEGGGFDVIDLGVNVPEARFIQAAQDGGAKVIAMSALLTTTMMQMKATIAEPIVSQERVKENQISLSKKALIGVSSAADRPRNKAGPRSG
jgi:methanogenic corrinoid protein MtbC1